MKTLGIIFAIIGMIGMAGVLSGIGGIFLWMFLGGTAISALIAVINFIRTGE